MNMKIISLLLKVCVKNIKTNEKTLDISQKLYEIFNKQEMRDKVINTLISRPEILEKYQTVE